MKIISIIFYQIINELAFLNQIRPSC